jgi:hypothetical protein
MCSFRYALSALCGFTLREIPKSATQRTRRTTEDHREFGLPCSVVYSSPTPVIPLCSLWLFSVPPVLLILRFVASRAEMLRSEAVPASIWSALVWLRLRRAMVNSAKHKLGAQRITAEEFSPSTISGKEASSPGDDLEGVTNVAHERVVRKWLLQKS